ncbi:hypothetical protein CHLRE_08g369900v5 [Chlamydomonas reinhardtii]|uniref:non-specific serine/threonine protein kinase n=1 Tax=Chlamydomonas reinhardtii TaxID=3055 RepID=A0A2K3DH56_CHLRE|nr:uncharacterized protein CHLRE_08g369900v5 [Chlamydomonas reinhardtii]PNW79868.1 hypothetical protein CHLRE_08g369900v5 [Chlamydomonas reinhardtii]
MEASKGHMHFNAGSWFVHVPAAVASADCPDVKPGSPADGFLAQSGVLCLDYSPAPSSCCCSPPAKSVGAVSPAISSAEFSPFATSANKRCGFCSMSPGGGSGGEYASGDALEKDPDFRALGESVLMALGIDAEDAPCNPTLETAAAATAGTNVTNASAAPGTAASAKTAATNTALPAPGPAPTAVPVAATAPAPAAAVCTPERLTTEGLDFPTDLFATASPVPGSTFVTALHGPWQDPASMLHGGFGRVGFCDVLYGAMHQPAAEAKAGGRRNHRGNKKQPRPALVTSVTAAAFKVLPLQDPGAHDAFMAEVSTHIRATNTGCDHICRVLGYRTGSMGPGVGGSWGFLYMQAAAGGAAGTLWDLWGANLAQHPDQGLPTAALQVVAASVLLALRALHAIGMAHLDLKPENIILGSDGLLKLIDFGLARRITLPSDLAGEAKSLTGVDGGHHLGNAARANIFGLLVQPFIGGTDGYKAPEICDRTTFVKFPSAWLQGRISGPKADCYSLGRMLTYLAAKPSEMDSVLSLPAEGSVVGSAALAHLQQSRGGRRLASLISGLTAVDPAARLGVEEALAHPALSGVVGSNDKARRWRW